MKKAVFLFLFFTLIFYSKLPVTASSDFVLSSATNLNTSSLNTASNDEAIVIINQIMIGQNKASKNEFIELYNPNSFNIDLQNYTLKKKSKSGSENVLISNKNFNGIIPAQGYFLISSPAFCANISCDLSYQNSNSLSADNTIILYHLSKNISDKVGYGEASDFYNSNAPAILSGQVLKRIQIDLSNPNNNLDYAISAPQITLHNSKGQKIELLAESQAENNSLENKKSNKNSASNPFINLWEINQINNNDYFSTMGIVSVLPGVLGSQYFYIHLEKTLDASTEKETSEKNKKVYGLQIYNYQKKFPDLKLGDKVKVCGQLSLTELCFKEKKDCLPYSNFYRLKTKEINDIQIISENNTLKVPPLKAIRDLSWTEINSLQTVAGEITQNKTNQIYIDDGEKEILLEIKKGTQIPAKTLVEGQFFTISGILSYKEEELKLSIINPEHIIAKEMKEDESLGVLLSDDFWLLEKQKNSKKFLKYILLIITATLIYFFYLKKKKT